MLQHTVSSQWMESATALKEYRNVSVDDLEGQRQKLSQTLRGRLAVSPDDVARMVGDGSWDDVAQQLERYLRILIALDASNVRKAILHLACPWPNVSHVDRVEDRVDGIGVARYLKELAKISGDAFLSPVEECMEALRQPSGRFVGTAVDWGCGGSPFKGWLEKHGANHDGQLFGVEIHPDAVEVACQYIANLEQQGAIRNGQVRIIMGDATKPHLLPSEILHADAHVSSLLLHELTLPEQILLILTTRANGNFTHSTYADTPFSLGLVVTYLGTWFVSHQRGVDRAVLDHMLHTTKRTMRATVPIRFLDEMWQLAGARAEQDRFIFVRCMST